VFAEGPLTYDDFVHQYDNEARVNVKGEIDQDDAWGGGQSPKLLRRQSRGFVHCLTLLSVWQ